MEHYIKNLWTIWSHSGPVCNGPTDQRTNCPTVKRSKGLMVQRSCSPKAKGSKCLGIKCSKSPRVKIADLEKWKVWKLKKKINGPKVQTLRTAIWTDKKKYVPKNQQKTIALSIQTLHFFHRVFGKSQMKKVSRKNHRDWKKN